MKAISKSSVLLICIILAGVILILVSGGDLFGKSSEDTITKEEYENQTEEMLSELYRSLYGIEGNILVKVNVSGNASNGNNPTVIGVAVICKATPSARAQIISLTSALLGISSARIFVSE